MRPGPAAKVGVSNNDRGLSYFHAIRLRQGADQVALVIVDAIRGGLYAPGDMLPRERDLAARFELSRPVVRQGLDVLRRQGVIKVTRGVNGGAIIASTDNLANVQTTADPAIRHDLRSMLETRRMLELGGALLAKQRAHDHEIANLTSLARDLDVAFKNDASLAQLTALDLRFHYAVIALSRNELIKKLYGDVIQQLMAVRSEYPFGHTELTEAVANQLTYAAALERRQNAEIRWEVDRHCKALELVYLGEYLEFVQ